MNRYLTRLLMIAVCAAILPASGVCQESTAKPAKVHGGGQITSRVPGDMLAKLNDSLQELASKVSPAVVQIEVTGFGPAIEGDRKDTVLIVHQHGVGAGVIVDPDGYIMTNAHVVESAQRIRVILSLPPARFDDVSSSRNMQVLNAKVIGLQKETDLALLKVEASNLPTLQFRLNVRAGALFRSRVLAAARLLVR